MEIEERVLFATPIFYSNIEIKDLDTVIKSILDKEKIFDSTHQTNIGGWQSPMFNVIDQQFEDIFKQITEMTAEIYKKYQAVNDPLLKQFWFNINRKGHYNNPHTHIKENFSGVLYLKVPEKCGNINFFNPAEKTKLEIEEYNRYTYSSYHFEPKVGDVFIFQSSLVHSVSKNETDSERISMAFDFY